MQMLTSVNIMLTFLHKCNKYANVDSLVIYNYIIVPLPFIVMNYSYIYSVFHANVDVFMQMLT